MSGLIEKSAVFFLVGFFAQDSLGDVEAYWTITMTWVVLLILLRFQWLNAAPKFWPLILITSMLGVLSSASSTVATMPLEGTLTGPFSAQIKQKLWNDETQQTTLRLSDLRSLKAKTSMGPDAGLRLSPERIVKGRGQDLILDGLIETGASKPWRFRGTVREQSGFSSIPDQAAETRDDLGKRLKQHVSRQLEPWLSALILGHDLESQSDRDLLRAAGAGHFFAVSGLHMGLVAALFIAALRNLHWERRRAQFWALFPLIFYALLTGGRPPVMRALAVIMMLVLADAVGRPLRPIRLLTLLFAVALAMSPDLLHDISFAFSFSAVAGILAMTGKTKIEPSALMRFLERKRRQPIRRSLKSTLLISEAAFLATAPLQAFYFGQIALVAILSSCFLLPIVILMLFLGLLGLIGPMPDLITDSLAQVLHLSLTGLASLPAAIVETGRAPKASLFIAWGGLAGAALWRRNGAPARKYRALAWLAFSTVVPLSLLGQPELVLSIDRDNRLLNIDWGAHQSTLDLQEFSTELTLATSSDRGQQKAEARSAEGVTRALRLASGSGDLIFLGAAPLAVMDLPWDSVETLVFGGAIRSAEALLLMERFGARNYLTLGRVDEDFSRLMTAEGYRAYQRDGIQIRREPRRHKERRDG